MFSWFLALPKMIKFGGVVAVFAMLLTLWVAEKASETKDAKEKAEKITAIYQQEQEETKKTVEVYNETRKDELTAIEQAEEQKEELSDKVTPPADEELRNIRKKVGDKFREGLPKKGFPKK